MGYAGKDYPGRPWIYSGTLQEDRGGVGSKYSMLEEPD
jgi:hypothetical protein